MTSVLQCGQVLHSGTVVDRAGRRTTYEVTFLGAEDLPELVTFRDRIFASLPDIDAYFPEVPEFVGWHIAERGRTLGLRSGGRLIGCAVIGIPQEGMPNFADDAPELGVARLSVAHMCSCMVDDDFRGNGLQRLLVSLRLMYALGLGRPHLFTRVAVINGVSLRNMLACGFLLRKVIVMHGTRLRYLLHLDLTGQRLEWRPEQAVAVAAGDVDGQRALLAEGLVGVAARGNGAQRQLLFVDPGRGLEGDLACQAASSSLIRSQPAL